jgi:hypothetical protein
MDESVVLLQLKQVLAIVLVWLFAFLGAVVTLNFGFAPLPAFLSIAFIMKQK